MAYWENCMDWPVVDSWKCDICDTNQPSMTWGFVNGQCRCDVCRAPYFMKMDNGATTDKPRLWFKSEYVAAAKAGWKAWQKPLDEWTDASWDAALEITKAVSEMKEG